MEPDIETVGEPVPTDKTGDPHGWIGTGTVQTRFGNFDFQNGYPTAEAADKLYELRTFSRGARCGRRL